MKTRYFISFALFATLLGGTVVIFGPRIVGKWRAVRPAIAPPPQDIVELIEKAKAPDSDISEPSENTTGIPLKLPPGFSISIFAKDVGSPRVLAWGPEGALFASATSQGKIFALRDRDGDGRAEDVRIVAEKLNKPHGITFRCESERCKMYIAEEGAVSTYDIEPGTLRAANRKKIIDLPSDGDHFTRTLMFLPYPNDAKLLISVGSSCNVCEEKDWRRAKVLIANADGSDLKVFASGLRNAVFLAAHPVTGKVLATEMGRDRLGDDLPPDEMNIVEDGGDYGWPICYGKNVHDTQFDKKAYVRDPCADKMPPQIELPAHSAPLGLAFVPEEGWPEDYWYNALVAYHGSWNRSEPTGYKIARMKLDAQGRYLGQEDFISGWLTPGGEALGRPADILAMPGGTVYISDDKAGVIYRVARTGSSQAAIPAAEDKSDLIAVDVPLSGALIKSPVRAAGKARGMWFFEASFPIRVLDSDGTELGVGVAQAQDEWMTTEFVPFEANVEFVQPSKDSGTLVLQKDNPSGLPKYDDELRIPIRFR